LKKGENGIYADLTDKERADRLEKVELHSRRNKLTQGFATTKNQDATESDLLQKHGSPEVTEGDVKNMLITTNIRPEFGEKYIKSIYAAPAEQTDPVAYNNVRMMQLSGKKQKDINNVVVDNIDKLTVDDKDALIKAKYDPKDIVCPNPHLQPKIACFQKV
jgi:hypothetical protein